MLLFFRSISFICLYMAAVASASAAVALAAAATAAAPRKDTTRLAVSRLTVSHLSVWLGRKIQRRNTICIDIKVHKATILRVVRAAQLELQQQPMDSLDHGLRPGGPWFSAWSPGLERKPPHSVWPLGLDRCVEGFRATLPRPHLAGPRRTDPWEGKPFAPPDLSARIKQKTIYVLIYRPGFGEEGHILKAPRLVLVTPTAQSWPVRAWVLGRSSALPGEP